MSPSDNVSESGERTDTVFGTVQKREKKSRSQQLHRFYEKWLLTPFKVIWSDWRARAGLLILLVYVLMGTVGIWATDVPYPHDAPRLARPFQNWHYILGADGSGIPLLRQMMYATPSMFEMIFGGAIFATAGGATIGMVAGFKGGIVDRVLMTCSDVAMTIPGLMLTIILAVWFQPRDPLIVGLLLASHRWGGFARSLRAQTLTLRQESYIEASRAIDLSTFSIVSKDLLPNLAPLIAIHFMNAARGIIFSSVGLYFLGVLPFTSVSNWGVALRLAYKSGGALYTLATAHWLLVPMATIVGLSLGLILLAQGMDRLFNPRIRAQHDTKLSAEDDIEPTTTTTKLID